VGRRAQDEEGQHAEIVPWAVAVVGPGHEQVDGAGEHIDHRVVAGEAGDVKVAG